MAAARNGDSYGCKGDIVLVVMDSMVVVASIDIDACDVVHVGVGIAVSVVTRGAGIYAGNENTVTQIAVVRKTIALIVDSLFNLRGEFGSIAGRETAIVTVGEMGAVRPSGKIKVGNMVVSRA